MADPRKNILIHMAECHLGTTFPEDDWEKDLRGIDELAKFIDIEHVLSLYANIVEIDLNKKLKFFTDDFENTTSRVVIFSKTRPCILNENNLLSSIQIASFFGPPTLALYNTLNNVFTPILDKNKQYDIKKYVSALQTNLYNIILAESQEKDFIEKSTDYTSLEVVQSLEQEIEYWKIASSSHKLDRLSRTSSTEFRNILMPIARDFDILDALPINEVEDLLEKAHNVLDDLWRHEPSYPKKRMKHLMNLIANDVCKYISKGLQNFDVWSVGFNEAEDSILQNISIGEKWCTSCVQLTEIFWPNYSSNPWKEGVYRPENLKTFLDLLHQVLNIRTLHRQLVRLLTSEEQANLKTDEFFNPFKEIDIFNAALYSKNLVFKAQKQFEYLLQPAEKMVALKLKKHLSAVNANTKQLLYEFSRYSELISRPILRQSLLLERQYLLSSLFDYIQELQSQSTTENQAVNTQYQTPQVVREIIAIRQLEGRCKEIQNVSGKVLDDLQNYNNLIEILDELAKSLKQQHNELFESWTSEVIMHIKNKSLSLKESDPVVQFSKQKLMKVNYSERLVMLISEVRQLKAMGYHIPSLIEETTDHAKQFMKHARILEQVANFHNTIGDRMITCLRPMMLTSALELSKLVQEQEVVTWGEEKSVERYVDLLNNAVEKLSRENNLLTSYYHQISDKIVELEGTDLIKDYSKWKETAKDIRQLLSQIEDKGFKNMQTWTTEIDRKLSDVLEKQYIKSLNSLYLYLPEIYTDLVYRSSGLEFSPNEENLRKQYEQQLKRFLDIPRTFRGVSNTSEHGVFIDIIERNQQALQIVTEHTDKLFEQLHNVVKHWQSWIQLESLDVNKLKIWQDWDLHFRASKTFGQEIAKLPSTEERVGCFLIGLSRFRSDLEAHNRSYWDQLVNSLKDSVAEDVVKLQNFIDPATASLTRQPLTVEEIGESGVVYSKIQKDVVEMEKDFNQMLQKSQTLASWSREQVESVNRLKGAWERLQSLLVNHQHIIARQIETIKTTLNIERDNISKEIERFAAKWEQIKPKQHSGDIADNTVEQLFQQFGDIKEKNREWSEVVEKRHKLKLDYEKFNIEVPELPDIEQVDTDLNNVQNSWSIFENFYTELQEMGNEYWIVFRKKVYIFEEFLLKWQNILKEMEKTELVTRLLQEVLKYEVIVPVLKYVRGEDFSERHWIDIFTLLGTEFRQIDQLVFKEFLSVSSKLEEHAKELQAICKKAASEIVIRQALAELDKWDVQTRFILSAHVDSHNKTVMVIKDFKEILNKIGDNQSLLQSVKNSSDFDSFSEKVNLWDTKLGDLDYYLTAFAKIQRKWMYLEPIFSSGTLAQEKPRFDRIDRDFHHILNFVEKDSRVAALCRYPNLRSLLENTLDQLARCQKSLNNFLQEKRNKFPRFLFLNDNDLLEVVGQSSKEHVIQAHLKKLFAGINSILLDETGQNITSFSSLEGETVRLSNSVDIRKPVEDWLNDLVKQMQVTLKELLVNCNTEGQAPDPLKYPSQVLCLSDNITFTLKCEQAISNMTLPPLLAMYKAQLSNYSSLELASNESNTGDASENKNGSVLELKLKALLLDTIHHISVLEELLDSNTTKVSDWTWQKQLRYYSNSLGEVTVKMANTRMEYSYEYLGNCSKLVRTPLTDKCFLTLTQGMHLGMGGNPYGPAGTGKTETVKELGSMLGRQVLVFNCDEGIDAASMGRILSGLVRSGAWGCFDEFNRLDEATLSAISMLIHPIQEALRANQMTIQLLDQEINVSKHCGIFVTLNPAGGGYGGRNKLPDNLKQLFRPVVMTHPDHEQIAKCLLLCDGYQNADLIAKKLIELFSLASKVLSKQQHYDWGLRAIRTILTGCGRALKQFRIQNRTTATRSLETEMEIVVKVLRTDTLCKLMLTDTIKFDRIIQDVFKGVVLEVIGNELLLKSLHESCQELNLIVMDKQINKCIELFEQLKQRMGVAIVGQPSCGKSTIRKLLSHALSKMMNNVKHHAFNPKSMIKTHLLGQVDAETKQWSDGVLSAYSLQVTSEPSDVWSWIVCDGDIDPEWIESLNSVLDDNRLLSLPSGWRIQFGSNVNFIFETHELSHASPATISRMGIILLSEEDLDLKGFIKTYIKQFANDVVEVIEPLIDEYFLRAIEWICMEGELNVPCSKIALVKTGLSQMQYVKSKSHFTVALANALGQLLQYDFRELFVQFVYEWTGEVTPPLILKSRYNKERDLIDSYFTNPNTKIEDVYSGLTLVQTGSVCQSMDCLNLWLIDNSDNNFLIVGPHGSAKMLMLNHLVGGRSDMEMITLHCSAHLQPDFIINKISQNCISVNTHRGKLYKPKKGKLVLYFKNLHLLEVDKWGTNILIEFLNQLIVYKGFFDSNTEFVGVENVTIVGSMIRTNTISPRFTSNLHILNVSLPEHEDLLVIVTAYLSAILKINVPSITKSVSAKFASTMILIYNKIKTNFSNLSQKHYIFSPHDLINWCTNILRYQNNENVDVEKFLIEVISYEALTLFGGRLVNNEDYEALRSTINEIFQHQWGRPNILHSLSDSYFIPGNQRLSNNTAQTLCEMKSEEWSSMVQLGIKQYERDGEILNLQISKELLNLTASVFKSVTHPGGNLVMVGRSGIGRRSATKIASALDSAKLVIPSADSQFTIHAGLKLAMQYAGLEGEQTYLLIDDPILTNDDNLSALNALINSGEVPKLYSSTELETMVKNLKDESTRANYEGDLIKFFADRVRMNLHTIVCMDVDTVHLWKIFQNCPALLQNCNIIWKSQWSNETIQTIPNLILRSDEDNGFPKTESNNDFNKIYEISRNISVAPTNFVRMVKLYEGIYQEKVSTIKTKQNKLQAGVSKLTETKDLVSKLKQDAVEQQNKLEEKQAKANAALDMISNTMKNANTHKEEMELLKHKTEEENQQLIKRKREIEDELSEVEPLIQEARSAVGNIKTESLSEIRSLRAPPDIIRDILEGVLRLMGIQDTSWNSMKTFLAKRGVKEDIRSFDAGRITSENRHAVERLMSVKRDSFDPKSAKRASVAAAPLAAWVAANVKYSHVMDKIKPLEREQNKLKANLTSAESQLVDLSAGLSDVDAAVAKLKVQLSAYTKEAAEIEIGLNKANETLATAEGLVLKLNDEYERWQEQLLELSEQLNKLSDNCLLASAFIAYLSCETEDKRMRVLLAWCKEINCAHFNLVQFFSSEREQVQWQSEGLSSDRLSTENAIIILKSDMVPLLIDPTSTATNWVKQHYKNKNVETKTQNSPKFRSALELAIRFGKVFIIEEVEYVSPILYPILRNEFTCQGERKLIRLNDKLLDYHKDFKLILSSRNEQLKLSADVKSLINIMNFTVTHAGLSEQLLSGAIRQENPELENRRKQLLRDKETLEEKQYQLQNQLLEDLAGCTGDILQDSKLLSSLNETKASSASISIALKESAEIQKKMQTEYDIYREISKFGSSLYFACNEFSKSNILYQLSVQAYTKLFLKSLQTFQMLDGNINTQKKHLLETIYVYMSRGIFKEDRLKFMLHLIQRLYPSEIPPEEWNLFLGHVAYTKNSTDHLPPWIPKQSLLGVLNIEVAQPELFSKLQLQDNSIWSNFMNSSECEKHFPSNCKLGEFEKVLVVQALRADRLYSSMINCCIQLTGIKHLDPPVLDLHLILKETANAEPILLLTMSGADPSNEIRELAQRTVGNEMYLEVAMGEGQEENALKLLQSASEAGKWLILKNLHLVTSWLPVLSQTLKSLEPHQNFRMWLLSEPNPNFNFVLAQNSLKLVYEIPQGLKSNLIRTYSSYGSKYFEKLNAKTSRIFFILSCLHALLQERRKYIPQGWSRWYEFSDTDLSTAVKLVEDLWQANTPQVPWKFISGLCSDAIYSGRIAELNDMNILMSYVRQYFNDDILSHRWRPFNLNIIMPSSADYNEYLGVLKQLPSGDVPSYFGLPENIDSSWEKQTSKKIIYELKNIYLTKTITNQFDKEIFHKGLSPLLSTWKKLNQGHDFIRTPVQRNVVKDSALETFIMEEYNNGLFLVQQIHKCFSVLNKICKGVELPDDRTLLEGTTLLKYEIPKAWTDLWTGPKEPTHYMRSIFSKMINISKWKENGIQTLLKNPVHLSHLFHPEAFFASFKQEFSRKSNVPIEQLVLQTSWAANSASDGSILLTELLIEGGLFDGRFLKPCLSNSNNINNAPDCILMWKEKKNIMDDESKHLNVPVYSTLTRENQITYFQVACDINDKDKWIQAGVAFYFEY